MCDDKQIERLQKRVSELEAGSALPDSQLRIEAARMAPGGEEFTVRAKEIYNFLKGE